MLSEEVAICVAGVGPCASLKVRKRASLCFHSKSDCTGSAKASGVRRCVRRGAGAGAAPRCVAWWA